MSFCREAALPQAFVAPHPQEGKTHAGYRIRYPEEVVLGVVHHHVAADVPPREVVIQDFQGAHRLETDDVEDIICSVCCPQ